MLDLRVYVFNYFWKILLIVDLNVAFVSFLSRTPTWIILYLLSLSSKSLKYMRGYFSGAF